jgi:hypothetical protein
MKPENKKILYVADDRHTRWVHQSTKKNASSAFEGFNASQESTEKLLEAFQLPFVTTTTIATTATTTSIPTTTTTTTTDIITGDPNNLSEKMKSLNLTTTTTPTSLEISINKSHSYDAATNSYFSLTINFCEMLRKVYNFEKATTILSKLVDQWNQSDDLLHVMLTVYPLHMAQIYALLAKIKSQVLSYDAIHYIIDGLATIMYFYQDQEGSYGPKCGVDRFITADTICARLLLLLLKQVKLQNITIAAFLREFLLCCKEKHQLDETQCKALERIKKVFRFPCAYHEDIITTYLHPWSDQIYQHDARGMLEVELLLASISMSDQEDERTSPEEAQRIFKITQSLCSLYSDVIGSTLVIFHEALYAFTSERPMNALGILDVDQCVEQALQCLDYELAGHIQIMIHNIYECLAKRCDVNKYLRMKKVYLHIALTSIQQADVYFTHANNSYYRGVTHLGMGKLYIKYDHLVEDCCGDQSTQTMSEQNATVVLVDTTTTTAVTPNTSSSKVDTKVQAAIWLFKAYDFFMDVRDNPTLAPYFLRLETAMDYLLLNQSLTHGERTKWPLYYSDKLKDMYLQRICELNYLCNKAYDEDREIYLDRMKEVDLLEIDLKTPTATPSTITATSGTTTTTPSILSP